MHICVTGGAGFIGSNSVRYFLEQGARVVVLDDFSTGKRENLEEVADRIEIVEGSITDAAAVSEALRHATHVLHLAAIPSVPRSLRDPITSHRVNIDGTFTVLMAARDAHVKKVVYAGSSSAYGNQGEDTARIPKSETMTPSPLSPYAVTKLVGEYYCRVFADQFSVPTVSIRYFNVFGPRQDPLSEYAAVIPRFITRMQRGEQPQIYGDGAQSRDFTFVENVVHANWLALQSDRAVRGEVINVACGESYTLLDLVSAINAALGTSVTPEFAEPRPGDVRWSRADITRARELLGYEPRVRFADGIAKTAAWYAVVLGTGDTQEQPAI